MKLEFSRQIVENFSKIKFHENLFNESRGVSSDQTERHYKANSRFSQYCERS